jgi:hypothetical protein
MPCLAGLVVKLAMLQWDSVVCIALPGLTYINRLHFRMQGQGAQRSYHSLDDR